MRRRCRGVSYVNSIIEVPGGSATHLVSKPVLTAKTIYKKSGRQNEGPGAVSQRGADVPAC